MCSTLAGLQRPTRLPSSQITPACQCWRLPPAAEPHWRSPHTPPPSHPPAPRRLPPKQQQVVTLRWGLLDGRPRTLKEVGDELGFTGVTWEGAATRPAAVAALH